MSKALSVVLAVCALTFAAIGGYLFYVTRARSDSGCGFWLAGGAILIGGTFGGLALLQFGGEERRRLQTLGWILLGLSLLPALLLPLTFLFPSLIPGS